MEFYDRQGKPIDQKRFTELWADKSYQTVRKTEFEAPFARGEISTVWLGLNHNYFGDGAPLIFETMVFFDGGCPAYLQKFDDYQCRYVTEEAAIVGHKHVMAEILDLAQGPRK
jgi:hypothetical protein